MKHVVRLQSQACLRVGQRLLIPAHAHQGLTPLVAHLRAALVPRGRQAGRPVVVRQRLA